MNEVYRREIVKHKLTIENNDAGKLTSIRGPRSTTIIASVFACAITQNSA